MRRARLLLLLLALEGVGAVVCHYTVPDGTTNLRFALSSFLTAHSSALPDVNICLPAGPLTCGSTGGTVILLDSVGSPANIHGNGSSATQINCTGDSSPLFTVPGGISARIEGVSISDPTGSIISNLIDVETTSELVMVDVVLRDAPRCVRVAGSLTAIDCKFADCGPHDIVTMHGAGINGEPGSVVTLNNTEFENCESNGDGGAVHMSGSLYAYNCIFNGNHAERGGAVVANSNDMVVAEFHHCQFQSNYATASNVSTVGALDIGNSVTTMTYSVRGCLFEGNFAYTTAGALRIEYGTNGTVEDTVFRSNSALSYPGLHSAYGGAVSVAHDSAGSASFTRCVFESNVATTGAGIIVVVRSNGITVTDTNFTANTATASGGGVTLSPHAHTAFFTRCQFVGNDGGLSGGGIYGHIATHSVVVTECVFERNVAGGEGGGLRAHVAEVRNTRFVQNTAGMGAGMMASRGNVTVEDCAFVGNNATVDGALPLTAPSTNTTQFGGGAGMLVFQATAALARCSFTDNVASLGAFVAVVSNATLNECVVQRNSATFGGSVSALPHSFNANSVEGGRVTLTATNVSCNSGLNGTVSPSAGVLASNYSAVYFDDGTSYVTRNHYVDESGALVCVTPFCVADAGTIGSGQVLGSTLVGNPDVCDGGYYSGTSYSTNGTTPPASTSPTTNLTDTTASPGGSNATSTLGSVGGGNGTASATVSSSATSTTAPPTSATSSPSTTTYVDTSSSARVVPETGSSVSPGTTAAGAVAKRNTGVIVASSVSSAVVVVLLLALLLSLVRRKGEVVPEGHVLVPVDENGLVLLERSGSDRSGSGASEDAGGGDKAESVNESV